MANKFEIGDYVTFTDNIGGEHSCRVIATQPSTYAGHLYELARNDNNTHTFWCTESEIAPTVYRVPSTGIYTVNLPAGATLVNGFSGGLVDGAVTTSKLASTAVKQVHRCVFNKTYQGLTYKEDMCECGEGANRRGLYE